jgi:8-oxo-dGTP pyrophosphatase MutT (NUDIX family)
MADVISDIVEGCVFRLRMDRPEFLLLRRSSHDSLYPGIWQIVTGSLRKGETSLEGMRREINEEIGRTPVRFWIVPHVSSFYDHRRDRISVVPFFAAQLPSDQEPILSDEHDRFEWVDLEEARRRIVWPSQMKGVEITHDFIVGGRSAAGLLEVR